MIYVTTPIPLGHTLTKEYQESPFKSLIFARWVLDYHEELRTQWKGYKKQYKEDIGFPDFCKIYFERHRDMLEPHLN